ncbi:unnamed protein product [Boreogadus saida]
MEDMVIVSVCARPILYDTTMESYRDRNKKELAWVDVAEETGLPVDVCRRKWKSLRDRYMREKKGEKDAKKSGSAARTAKKWKFFVVLSFLDPFVTPRETSSNLPRVAEYEIEDDGAAETSLSGAGEAYEECDEAAGPSHNADQPSVSDSDEGSAAGRPTPAPDTVPAADPVPPADPVPAAAPRPPGGSKRKRATRVPCGQDPIQEAILQALHNEAAQTAQTPPPPQLSEDAFFVQSILPSLERLPRQACAELKFEIHKLVLEATRLNWNPNN